jgi:hypothetical protein
MQRFARAEAQERDPQARPQACKRDPLKHASVTALKHVSVTTLKHDEIPNTLEGAAPAAPL